MSATSIGPVKAMMLSLDVGAARARGRGDAGRPGREDASLREPLQALAERLGVRL